MTFPLEVTPVFLSLTVRPPCPSMQSFSDSSLCCYHAVSFNYFLKARLYWHTSCQIHELARLISPSLPKLGKEKILAIIKVRVL